MLARTPQSDLYFIDVGQAVEHDHPYALEFLRADCTNISEFFAKRGVLAMPPRGLFDFVTDVNITADRIETYLENVQEKVCI